MSRKRHTAEQIIAKLREAEIELAKGHKTPDVVVVFRLAAVDTKYAPRAAI